MVYYYWLAKNGNWYWHLKASNGRIIADGAEGYTNENDCLAGISLVQRSGNAPVRRL
ncbi:hypothetical protein Pan44_04390 [Caulifigura coniformis]|uniref:DUF1508 domain-containing protein n=1 Tax=Caulifigura coniformis TaxID=2527983 RepID=A0A517S8I9_9PLAN|nr:YegP family protein [Caulifigura coniformis]QDT52428.1 hypothetical protein Pan44_04390 [Caulifigura coniformis]